MNKPSRIKALLLAILVTIIWSTSWVLIKIGLADVPALTFAGLRYMLASILFFPILLKKNVRVQIKALTKKDWFSLIWLGIILYMLGQGGQYLGLAFLPSVTVSLILNLSALFVALVSSVAIKEKLNWLQWIGILLNLAGVLIYFNPSNHMQGNWLGWLFAFVSLIGNSVGSILGREINRNAKIHPIVITGISMTIGSVLMLLTGILWQGLPALSARSIWIIVILALVNTAVCFSLWNYTQQTLMATETTILNNTMLVYVSILAWIFLGEKQSVAGMVGLGLALAGAMIVQVRLKQRTKGKAKLKNTNDPTCYN
jgi:drug/metabolite transporter (DMT)-like permease